MKYLLVAILFITSSSVNSSEAPNTNSKKQNSANPLSEQIDRAKQAKCKRDSKLLVAVKIAAKNAGQSPHDYISDRIEPQNTSTVVEDDSSDSSVDRNAEYFWKYGYNSHYDQRRVSDESTDSQRANPADDVRYNPDDDEGRRNPYSDQIDVRHNIDDSYVYNPSDRDAYNPNDFEHIQLQAAIQQSNQEAIKDYLDQGADLQKHTGVGGSPLIFSAVQQYINAFTDEAEKEAREVVLTLLQRGANIHQRGQRGPDQRPPLLRGVQYWSSGNLKKFLTGFDEFITVSMLQEAINEAVSLQRASKKPQLYDSKIELLHKFLKKKDN